MHLVKFKDTEQFIDDYAFALMSTSDLFEQKDMTVLCFMPTNDLLNTSFKETRLISIRNSNMKEVLPKKVDPRKHYFLVS